VNSIPKNSVVKHPEVLKPLHGAPIFPCKDENKSPYTTNGFYDATTDPEQIAKWWKRWPNALTGMPTGAAGGRWVLDIDPRHGGLESLAALEREHAPLPKAAPRVRTRSGGWHIYLELPADGTQIRNSAGKIAPGIDVRGEGGYVITPPSPGWEYIGDARTPAPAPEWLVALALAKPKPQEQRGPHGRAGTNAPASPELGGAPIPDGTRNASLFSIAGHLHDGTRDLGQLTKELFDINDRRCSPPLPESEVAALAENMFINYEPCRPTRQSRRRTPPEVATLSALDVIEAQIRTRPWGRYKSDRDVMIIALKEARLHGRLVGDALGVHVSISIREWAPKAAVSKQTLLNAVKRLRIDGLLRRDDAERRGEPPHSSGLGAREAGAVRPDVA
jgi:Bifunctional DNA primase/polymerase, N-terminal/Primase C terminal 1 (PriCT-1)